MYQNLPRAYETLLRGLLYIPCSVFLHKLYQYVKYNMKFVVAIECAGGQEPEKGTCAEYIIIKF